MPQEQVIAGVQRIRPVEPGRTPAACHDAAFILCVAEGGRSELFYSYARLVAEVGKDREVVRGEAVEVEVVVEPCGEVGGVHGAIVAAVPISG